MTVPPVRSGDGRSSWQQDGPPPPVSATSQPYSPKRRPWIWGVALAAIVTLVVGLVVWKSAASHDGHGLGDPDAAASGGVDRTIGVLREKDPVCDDWATVSNELAAHEEKWAASNRGIPSTAWSPEQRQVFITASTAMGSAADKYELMLSKATNVVVQELIAQTIVYLRSYVERIPNYVEADSLIAGVAGNFGTAVTYMCSVAPLVAGTGSSGGMTHSTAPEPAALVPFMNGADPACTSLVALIDRQNSQLGGWSATDSTVPSAHWTPTQRDLNFAAREVISRDAMEIRAIAKTAESAIFADLLVARADYMQVFADSIPTYKQDDALLWTTVSSLGGGLTAACKAKL